MQIILSWMSLIIINTVFAKDLSANFILRGLRNTIDFDLKTQYLK